MTVLLSLVQTAWAVDYDVTIPPKSSASLHFEGDAQLDAKVLLQRSDTKDLRFEHRGGDPVLITNETAQPITIVITAQVGPSWWWAIGCGVYGNSSGDVIVAFDDNKNTASDNFFKKYDVGAFFGVSGPSADALSPTGWPVLNRVSVPATKARDCDDMMVRVDYTPESTGEYRAWTSLPIGQYPGFGRGVAPRFR